MLQSGLQSADSFGQETTNNRSCNMSIEVTLKELTEALKANTAALLSAGGSTGGATGGATAEEGKTTKPAAAGKTTKPAAGKTTKPAAKPAAEESESEGEVDLDKVKDVFGGFLKIDDEKKRALRKKFAGTLLEQYGVAKASDLDPQDYAEAVDFIERALAGEKVDPSTAGARLKAAGGAEEEEEEDDGMV